MNSWTMAFKLFYNEKKKREFETDWFSSDKERVLTWAYLRVAYPI